MNYSYFFDPKVPKSFCKLAILTKQYMTNRFLMLVTVTQQRGGNKDFFIHNIVPRDVSSSIEIMQTQFCREFNR